MTMPKNSAPRQAADNTPQNPLRLNFRLFVEFLLAIAAAEFIIAIVLPLISEGMNETAESVMDFTMLMAISGPLALWRMNAAMKRNAELQTKGFNGRLSPQRAGRVGLYAAGFVLIAGCVCSITGAWGIRQKIEESNQAKFDQLAERIRMETTRRFKEYSVGIYAARGLFEADLEVTREEFHTYFASQPVDDRFEGSYGFGFIERVARKDVAEFARAQRADKAPDFAVRTCGNSADCYVVKYFAPPGLAEQWEGIDVNSFPAVRQAAEQSMLSGDPTLTGKVTLGAEAGGKCAYLYLLPMYGPQARCATPADRQRALVGWAFSPIIVEETLGGVSAVASGQLEMEVYDGAEIKPESLIFDSNDLIHKSVNDAVQETGRKHAHVASIPILVGGRQWMLWLSTDPSFEATVDRSTPALVFCGGVIISILLALVTYGLGSGRARALRLAQEMTADLALARDQAQTANRAKSQFLANMSHEIRTPLTAILGYADLLREESQQAADPELKRTHVETIRAAGQHLLSVINNILDLSKIEADKMALQRTETDLPGILKEVEAYVKTKASEKGIAFEIKLDTPVPAQILADAVHFKQIILNLAANAVKFTEAGAVIVSVRVAGNRGAARLQIDVEDTGRGMTSQQAEVVFNPFSQADSGMARKFGGTGLGLTISRRLAELMGGTVTLERTQPSVGSMFRLDLPLNATPGAQAVQTLGTASMKVVSTPIGPDARLNGRILLAEDGPDNQRLISFHLKKAGAVVDVAENGAIALEMLERAADSGMPYDMLLTDMQMPEMDGYTLARTLRHRGSTLAIVALTAHAMTEDREKCLNAGCDDYATKPIDKTKLVDMCYKWLGASSTWSRKVAA